MNNNILKLIPKYEEYIKYELDMVIKIPKVAKQMIGNKYIENLMDTLKDIYLIQKLPRNKRLLVLNEIDAYCGFQRSSLRVMYRWRYIDEKKFNVSMQYLKEIGLMLGGYLKTLVNTEVSNTKESVDKGLDINMNNFNTATSNGVIYEK